MEAYTPSGLIWTGPDSSDAQGGLTFSLLSRFLVCPERFFLCISGKRERPRFDPALEFGSLFQLAMEDEAAKEIIKGKPTGVWTPNTLERYGDVLMQRYTDHEDRRYIDLWVRIAVVVAKAYREAWAEADKGVQQIEYEKEFRVSYTPHWPSISGRSLDVPDFQLRGKRDGVLATKGPTRVIGGRRQQTTFKNLQENKTKSQIDEEGLLGTVAENLQTMIYMLAYTIEFGEAPAGIVYNVVRRPTIRPDSRKKESVPQFLERLAGVIAKDPSHYFKRWTAQVSPDLMQRYRKRTLDPLLYRIWTWWEDVSRFVAEGDHERRWETPLHYQAPWGVYNSLAAGFRGDYFDHLTKGAPLHSFDDLFPELGDAE